MLNVRCKNEGCNAVFKSGERDKHERECDAAPAKCSVSDKCAPIPRFASFTVLSRFGN